MISYSDWLDEKIRESKITNRALGYYSGIDHSTVARLRSGTRKPLLQTAVRLADVLDWVSFVQLIEQQRQRNG